MEKKKKEWATSLQMVEVDHHKFAIELHDGEISVNLTHLAQSFDKRAADWLRTTETKDYLMCLAEVRKCVLADLVKVRYGGKPGSTGTWCTDYRIAMRFAQWLSPEFSIAVDEMLVKLLTRNAVVAEPIAGVWPIIQNGVVGYPRKEILQASGYSYTSGSLTRYKKRFPADNFHILRIACFSPRLANLVHERGKVRQMELQFTNPKALA